MIRWGVLAAGTIAATMTYAANAAADEFRAPRPGLVACYMETVADRPFVGRVKYSVVAVQGEDAVLDVDTRTGEAYRLHTYRGVHSYKSSHPEGDVTESFAHAFIDSFGHFEIGKTARADMVRTVRRGSRTEVQRGSLTLAIEGREQISVPAGEFTAWIVLRRIETHNARTGDRYRQDRRSWYVPQLGWFVRMRLAGNAAAGPPRTLELLRLAELAAADAREMCERTDVGAPPGMASAKR